MAPVPMIASVWFMSMVVLLVLTNIIPSASICAITFNGAITVFYIPFVIGAIYILSLFDREFWYAVGLLCLFLWTMSNMAN